MFCQKNCSVTHTVTKIVTIGVMVIGAMGLLCFHLSMCDCLRRRTHRLACECGEAVGDATVRIANAVDECVSSDKNAACGCDED